MPDDRRRLPCEEYEDVVLEIAFAELLLEECEALEAEPLTEEEEALLQEAGHQHRKHLNMIDRELRKRHTTGFWGRTAVKFLRVAAMVVMIISIGFGSALAISPDLRISVIKFLTVVTNEYVWIGFENKADQKVEVPDGWLADYYPAYIPEGYELAQLVSDEMTSQATYRGSEGFVIFSIASAQLNTQMNSRNASTQTIRIHEQDATMLMLPDSCIITWAEGSSYIVVTATSKDVALLVSESTSLVLAR